MKSPHKVIIVYDLETGGLNKEKHDITEVAMVAVNAETLEVMGTYSSLIKKYSENEYSEEAKKVTGITEEMLEAEGKDIDEVIEDILDFIGEHKIGTNKPILGGHKIKKFDNGFFEKLWDRRGRKMSKDVDMDVFFDSLEESRWAFTDLENYELGTCCKNVGIIFKGAHRALNDTMANAKLIIELLKKRRGEGSGGSAKVDHRANFDLF